MKTWLGPKNWLRNMGIWMAKSKYLGLTVPRFTVFFSIEGDAPESERILLLWIEEISTAGEISGSLS